MAGNVDAELLRIMVQELIFSIVIAIDYLTKGKDKTI